MRNFKKYDIWTLSHSFALEAYKITASFTQNENYGLVSQIRRAATSIPTNIAEGCGRNSDKEFNQFLNIALGSACEVEHLFILSKDLKYISQTDFNELEKQINVIKSKTYNLKEKLRA